MGKYVKISSMINIGVTNGLSNINVTNTNQNIQNNFKVVPLWTKTLVDIHIGVDYYPAQIKEYSTVKELQRKNLLSILEEVDEILVIGDTDEEIEKSNQLKLNAEKRLKEYELNINSIDRQKELYDEYQGQKKRRKRKKEIDNEDDNNEDDE